MYRPVIIVTLGTMNTHRLIAFVGVTVLIIGVPLGSAEGETEMIAVGESFVEFELPAHDGSTVKSADFEGRPYLLFFYPKADTGG